MNERQRFSRLLLVIPTALCAVTAAGEFAVAEDGRENQEVFFEKQIRPLLAAHCFKCHGEKKQQAELRLDSAAALKKGNSSGPAVVPGKPDDSRLWQVVQYSPLDVQMPPDGKLPERQLNLLRKWIETGAFWPEQPHRQPADTAGPFPTTADGEIDFAQAVQQHWGYRQIANPPVPQVKGADQCRTALDRFILAKLEPAGLTMSEEADRRTLIRRLSFGLLGLPPKYEEVETFVQDERPGAYERLVNRLLASPHYGERWGRHWLDVARYADTKGYVFTENRFYPYSYTYRDYVIEAFNADKPYDRFVTEQLAADLLDLPENDPALAALGFLTVGPRFLNREPDIIDDRIDVVTRGLMGMTMACARCHDHKFDPLPSADYYSLYGVFASCYEPELPPLVGEVDESAPGYREFKQELDKRQAELEDYVRKTHAELLEQMRLHAADYLQAAMKAANRGPEGLEPAYEHGDPRDKLTRHWMQFLAERVRERDPDFVLLESLSKLDPAKFATQAAEVIAKARSAASSETGQTAGSLVNPLILAELQSARLENVFDLARAYGNVFERVQQNSAEQDPHAKSLRDKLIGPGSLTALEASSESSPLFGRDHRDHARKLARKVDEWRVQSEAAPARAMVVFDKERPEQPVIFQRGDPGRRGERVPRRGPQILGGGEEAVFDQGSGRLELARLITAPDNPLTARVIVNRIWMHHFGEGLVSTASDFGTRGMPPTHPELLDHLAWRLIHEFDWSLKALHREILLSQVYRQKSRISSEAEKGRAIDPENQLLWRQNRRRLEFEPYRDSLLAAAGRLDSRQGGRPVDIVEKPDATCRTVYGLIDRNNLPGLYRTFDFPAPDTSSPGRPETTVPQQALFALNAEFTQRCADGLAARARAAGGTDAQIVRMFELALSRRPDDAEMTLLRNGLAAESVRLEHVAQALLMSNEFLFID